MSYPIIPNTDVPLISDADITAGTATTKGTVTAAKLKLAAETHGGSGVELSQAQATDANSTAFGLVSGERLAQSVVANSRELVTTERTYYVNKTTGNNSNDGLSSGAAFATVQHGIDVICNTLDLGADITLQIADNTYNEEVLISNTVGSKSIVIAGNPSNPSGVTIDAGSATTAIRAIFITGGKVILKDVYAKGARAIEAMGGLAYIDLQGTVTAEGTFRSLASGNQAVITINNTATLRIKSTSVGIYTNNGGIISTYSGALTILSGSTVGSAGFFQAVQGSGIVFGDSTLTGSITGVKGTVLMNSFVTINFALGTTAAVTSTGGQYVSA